MDHPARRVGGALKLGSAGGMATDSIQGLSETRRLSTGGPFSEAVPTDSGNPNGALNSSPGGASRPDVRRGAIPWDLAALARGNDGPKLARSMVVDIRGDRPADDIRVRFQHRPGDVDVCIQSASDLVVQGLRTALPSLLERIHAAGYGSERESETPNRGFAGSGQQQKQDQSDHPPPWRQPSIRAKASLQMRRGKSAAFSVPQEKTA